MITIMMGIELSFSANSSESPTNDSSIKTVVLVTCGSFDFVVVSLNFRGDFSKVVRRVVVFFEVSIISVEVLSVGMSVVVPSVVSVFGRVVEGSASMGMSSISTNVVVEVVVVVVVDVVVEVVVVVDVVVVVVVVVVDVVVEVVVVVLVGVVVVVDVTGAGRVVNGAITSGSTVSIVTGSKGSKSSRKTCRFSTVY